VLAQVLGPRYGSQTSKLGPRNWGRFAILANRKGDIA